MCDLEQFKLLRRGEKAFQSKSKSERKTFYIQNELDLSDCVERLMVLDDLTSDPGGV
jgi:hypothetical protein